MVHKFAVTAVFGLAAIAFAGYGVMSTLPAPVAGSQQISKVGDLSSKLGELGSKHGDLGSKFGDLGGGLLY